MQLRGLRESPTTGLVRPSEGSHQPARCSRLVSWSLWDARSEGRGGAAGRVDVGRTPGLL